MKDMERHKGMGYMGIWRCIFFYFLIPFTVYFFSSCGNSKYSDYKKTDSGLMYKFQSRGNDSVHPKYGEIVRVKMIKLFGDSVLENTDMVKPGGLKQYLQKPVFKGAIEEGILLMGIGDSASFLIPTDSVNKYFVKDSSKQYKRHDYLSYGIKLMSIQTLEDAQREEEQQKKIFIQDRKENEPKELSRYLEDNHINVKPSSSGLYFIETTKGKGASPKDGDSVIVQYTGSFLNGTIFDSSVKRNESFSFIVNDKGKTGVIPAWNEAIKMMKKGSAATIVIPSSLAYDSAGVENPKTRKYFILPYSPMKFDIQLVNIKPKK